MLKPVIIPFAELAEFKASQPNLDIIDSMPEAIEDLFKIDFPFIGPKSPEYELTFKVFKSQLLANKSNKSIEELGNWIYFPWRQALVHLPSSADFIKLRTARNKFLITQAEQDLFYGAKIGVGGLSVGSWVVNSIVLSGGGGCLNLADHDTLSITNLNRLYGSVCDLTKGKADSLARKIYELNPYQELNIFSEGLELAKLTDFFVSGDRKLDLFVEEMDNLKMKIESRFFARKLRVPVVMATDNGDNAIVDVERFDLEPNRPLFHGVIPDTVLADVPEQPNLSQRINIASKIVGSDITPRTQQSLMAVGTKLPSWPQLGNAATLSGVAVSYVARRIVTGQPMPSGRYEISLDQVLDPDYSSESSKVSRQQQKVDFEQSLAVLFGDNS